MTDIDIKALVERLREHARMAALTMARQHVCWQAADALEALQARAEKAEARLKAIGLNDGDPW